MYTMDMASSLLVDSDWASPFGCYTFSIHTLWQPLCQRSSLDCGYVTYVAFGMRHNPQTSDIGLSFPDW